MKKTYTLISIFIVSILLLLPTGCKRKTGEVWEDTKTAGRYMGRGMRSLTGKHGESRQVKSQHEFAGGADEEYIPLEDEDLDQNVLYASIPQSRIRPGEPGGDVPGVESFEDASSIPELSSVFQTIYFPYNSDSISDSAYLETVYNIASYLKKHPNTYVFVEGHCDQRGSTKYNFALGSDRSEMIRRLLVREGVNPDVVFTVSYGKERPVAFGDFESSWKQNRRAQFKIYVDR